MYNKKFIAIAVAVLVIITVLGISVGINQYNQVQAPPPEQTQGAEDAAQNTASPQASNQTQEGSAEPAASADSSGNAASTADTAAAEEKTPVFIYFVAETDPDYDEAMSVFEALESEYEGRIEFDLRNVTQDPSILENFSLVKDNTPALIMDGKDGISGILLKNTNEDDLRAEIEKALE